MISIHVFTASYCALFYNEICSTRVSATLKNFSRISVENYYWVKIIGDEKFHMLNVTLIISSHIRQFSFIPSVLKHMANSYNMLDLIHRYKKTPAIECRVFRCQKSINKANGMQTTDNYFASNDKMLLVVLKNERTRLWHKV